MKAQFIKTIRYRWIASAVVMALILSQIAAPVFAEAPSSAREQAELEASKNAFPAAEVEAMVAEANKMPVEPDKPDSEVDTESVSPGAMKGMGSYPGRKGVILVTADAFKGLIPTGHAAIVYKPGEVVESNTRGVVKGKNNWDEEKKTCYGVTVKKTTNAQDARAANWCYK